MTNVKIPYYEDRTRYSNSNAGQYLQYGPMYLRNYLDNKEKGLDADFLKRGTMIHMYILQYEDFWKTYKILDYETPKINQQKILCATYSQEIKINPLASTSDLLLQCYNKAYSNSKSDLAKLQEAQDIVTKYASFIEFGTMNSIAISFADVQMLKQIKENLEKHKLARTLLFNLPNTIDVQNEFHINWEFPKQYYDVHLPCKSLLDRVHIDEVNKEITLIDLKTTSSLYEFEQSMVKFDYCRQLKYYWLALEWYMKNERKIDISKYTCKTYIIAISTTGSHQIRVFNITDSQLADKTNVIENTISELAWHHKNDTWQHKRTYYEGDGSERIEIQSVDSNK